MLLYLHGFRSSPQSRKAQQIAARMAALGRSDEYVCPQLPASPRAAAQLLEEIAARVPVAELAVIGSSLGGYYATWLAEATGCRAALLNPAITPYVDLRAYLGEQSVYFSDQSIDMRPEYLDQLLALDTPRITRPERFFLLAATGDELIDYRTMVAKYAGGRQHVIEGSDHQIADFAQYMDEVLGFCGIDTEREQ
ncbi:MAG: YqiA/YcfP family alpha/beta fold hydrolase [Betaproteobacteria bacterium]